MPMFTLNPCQKGILWMQIYVFGLLTLYKLFVVPKANEKRLWSQDPLGHVFYRPCREVKCFPCEYETCEKNNVDGWSAAHFLMHLVIGLFFPRQYWFVLLLSITFEFMEYHAIGHHGARARFLVDPAVNLLGYVAGSALSPGFLRKTGLVGM